MRVSVVHHLASSGGQHVTWKRTKQIAGLLQEGIIEADTQSGDLAAGSIDLGWRNWSTFDKQPVLGSAPICCQEADRHLWLQPFGERRTALELIHSSQKGGFVGTECTGEHIAMCPLGQLPDVGPQSPLDHRAIGFTEL